jgi:hypothetical protein
MLTASTAAASVTTVLMTQCGGCQKCVRHRQCFYLRERELGDTQSADMSGMTGVCAGALARKKDVARRLCAYEASGAKALESRRCCWSELDVCAAVTGAGEADAVMARLLPLTVQNLIWQPFA